MCGSRPRKRPSKPSAPSPRSVGPHLASSFSGWVARSELELRARNKRTPAEHQENTPRSCKLAAAMLWRSCRRSLPAGHPPTPLLTTSIYYYMFLPLSFVFARELEGLCVYILNATRKHKKRPCRGHRGVRVRLDERPRGWPSARRHARTRACLCPAARSCGCRKC